MTDEKDHSEEHEESEEQEEREDKEKSSFDASLNALTETIKGFDINGLRDDIAYVGEKMDNMEARLKALEEPTDLPLKPKVSAEDDIGAKVKAPDDYQSNSEQASIKDSDPENETEDDDNGLKMQEKSFEDTHAFTTETPRPGAALETVEKSAGVELNAVLKAARETGAEGLSGVGKRILKGEFGSPEQGELQW